MTRLSGGGTPRPPQGDPPRWLLALGCVAVALMVGGLLLGGEIGTRLVAWGCLAFPALVGTFLAFLALRSLRSRDGK